MTTCTWDKQGRLSADTRSITGDVTDQSPCQKIFQKNGVFCAVAGDIGEVLSVVKYLLRNDPEEVEPDYEEDSFELMLVSKTRSVLYLGNLKPLPLAAPYAIGSGGNHAVAAMLCGKSGREAIRIAAKMDANTGIEFGIRTYKVR